MTSKLLNYPRLAVIGSRAYPESSKEVMFKILDKFLEKYKVELIVSGGAIGSDYYSEEYSKINKISRYIIVPKWHDQEGRYIKAAGFIRNKEIIDKCDYCLAFIVPDSMRGTRNSLDWCQKLGKPYVAFDETGKVFEKYEIKVEE